MKFSKFIKILKNLYSDGYNLLTSTFSLIDFYEEFFYEEISKISNFEKNSKKIEIFEILEEFSKREDILSNFKINEIFGPKKKNFIFRSLLVKIKSLQNKL